MASKKIEFTMSEAVPGEAPGDPVQLPLHTHGHRSLRHCCSKYHVEGKAKLVGM